MFFICEDAITVTTNYSFWGNVFVVKVHTPSLPTSFPYSSALEVDEQEPFPASTTGSHFTWNGNLLHSRRLVTTL